MVVRACSALAPPCRSLEISVPDEKVPGAGPGPPAAAPPRPRPRPAPCRNTVPYCRGPLSVRSARGPPNPFP